MTTTMNSNIRELIQNTLQEEFGGRLFAALQDADFVEGVLAYYDGPKPQACPFYGRTMRIEQTHDELRFSIRTDPRPPRDVLLDHFEADGKTLAQILKTKEGRRDLAALAPSDQPFDGWRVYCKGTSVLVERVERVQ